MNGKRIASSHNLLVLGSSPSGPFKIKELYEVKGSEMHDQRNFRVIIQR